jgi:hypothetical protein
VLCGAEPCDNIMLCHGGSVHAHGKHLRCMPAGHMRWWNESSTICFVYYGIGLWYKVIATGWLYGSALPWQTMSLLVTCLMASVGTAVLQHQPCTSDRLVINFVVLTPGLGALLVTSRGLVACKRKIVGHMVPRGPGLYKRCACYILVAPSVLVVYQ